jgi:hypothetical protein
MKALSGNGVGRRRFSFFVLKGGSGQCAQWSARVPWRIQKAVLFRELSQDIEGTHRKKKKIEERLRRETLVTAMPSSMRNIYGMQWSVV